MSGGIGWGLLSAAVCAWMIPLEPSLLEEGMIVQIAQRLLAGEHLYRDIVLFTGPLPFESLALLFRVFGEEIAVARGALVVLTGLGGAATFSLARRAGAGAWSHAAAAWIAAAPVLLFPHFSMFFYATLAFHGCVIAAWAAARGEVSFAWALTAGAVAACVALCKQTVGAGLALALFAVLAAGARGAGRGRAALGLALGGAVVATATLTVFALRGDVAALFTSLVSLPLSLEPSFASPFPNLWPPGRFTPEIQSNAGWYVPQLLHLLGGADTTGAVLTSQLFYALPFLALVATGVAGLRGTLPLAVWLHAAALAALVTNLYPRTDWGHLVFVLPAAGVQLLLLTSPRHATPSRGRAIAAGVAAGGIAIATLSIGGVLHAMAGPASFGPRVPQRPVSALLRGPAVPRAVAYLREHAQVGEPIFVPRAEPLLYFATDTRNPTPYSGVVPGNRDAQQAAILAGLEGVRFVAMSEVDRPVYSWYGAELPEVQAYLERHFRVAAPFAAAQDAWMVVLERGPDRGRTLVDLTQTAEVRAWIREANGLVKDVPTPPMRLAARHNRRPLPFLVGAGGGGLDFTLEVPTAPGFQGEALAGVEFQADVGLATVSGVDGVYHHAQGARLRASIGAAGRLETIAEASLPGAPEDGASWTPLEANLSAWSGRRVTLRLELVPTEPLPELRLAWWGSPRIAAPPAHSLRNQSLQK
jgi:hypothetical protein